MKRIGVDVGGTHTDLVLVDETSGEISVNKIPTSTDDPAKATLTGVLQLCQSAAVDPASIDYFMHGTTIATNIIIEHNGARTGMITTEGFRDILHIARSKRPFNFSVQLDLPWQKFPLVQRRFRIPVPERICGPHGEVLKPLDEEAVRAAARKLRDQGVEAIAVCFLFSFLNPEHERRASAIVAEEHPQAFICSSHEIIAQYREFERFSTACLNAYVGPKTAGYIDRLARALKQGGLGAELHLMQSNGGCTTAASATRRPVTLLMSGPVAGLIGGIWAGQLAGQHNIISLDVGGTSADIGVAPENTLRVKHLLDTRIGDYQAMVPMADVDTIGAGGGSIAYIDPGGQFQVGPKSAGADPGPCCYGRGGMEPTATDCQLVLGRIDPHNYLGGQLPLDLALAHRAVEQNLARPLGMSIEQAALSAIKILNHNMIQAIEVNSVRKGYDPRDFALLAFGGAGPLFACDIAAELAIPSVVIPVFPGLTSALGLLTSDISYDFSRTELQLLSNADCQRLSDDYNGLQTQTLQQLQQDHVTPESMLFTRYADCRYQGQGYELRTPAPGGAVDENFLSALRISFEQTHQREYGSVFSDKDIEIVNIRVIGVGRIPQLRPQEIPLGNEKPPLAAVANSRPVIFEIEGKAQTIATPHYIRSELLAGNCIKGPAIIAQMDATTVLPPDVNAVVDNYGNMLIANLEPRL